MFTCYARTLDDAKCRTKRYVPIRMSAKQSGLPPRHQQGPRNLVVHFSFLALEHMSGSSGKIKGVEAVEDAIYAEQ
jgi:hypothetical protein